MSTFRSIAFAAIIAAVPFAANAAGQGSAQTGGSSVGTQIYSPTPLVVQTAAVPHARGSNATQQKRVRIASASTAGTWMYQPSPLLPETHRQRLIAEINQAYGTRFPVHPENQAVASNAR